MRIKKFINEAKSSKVLVTTVTDLSFSDQGPLLETLEFLEIIHGSYQPLNFLPHLTLSTQYSIFILLTKRYYCANSERVLEFPSSFLINMAHKIYRLCMSRHRKKKFIPVQLEASGISDYIYYYYHHNFYH